MMIVKASKGYEAGQVPSDELIAAVGNDNEELMKAGVLLDLSGLQPTSQSARVKFSGGKTTVIDGPFAETKEQLGGFWVIRAPDLDAALAWAARGSEACRAPVEVRPFQETGEE